MDLKFTFGASNPLPLSTSGAGSASAPGPGSSVLELRVTLLTDESLMRCEGLSGDGVAYASAEKSISDEDPASLAAALRSVVARCGAALPEPLIGSVGAIVLDLAGGEASALKALGLHVATGSTTLAQVDESLQARTGITAGTPILAA